MNTPPVPSADEPLLTRYLLGHCTEEEMARVERDFFATDETFDRLCDLEEELFDRYEAGGLLPEERKLLERACGGGSRRERLLFSLALRRTAAGEGAGGDQEPGTLPPHAAVVRTTPGWLQWLALEPWPARALIAAACLLFAAAVGLQMRAARHTRSALESAAREAAAQRTQVEEARQRAAESDGRAAALAEQLSRERAARQEALARPGSRPIVATFVLAPGLTRSARGPVRVLVPHAADTVRLQLELEPDGYSGFRADLVTAAGDLVWSEAHLRVTRSAAGRSVPLAVPATLLANGQYEVVLRGRLASEASEELASYHFEVLRR
jgi:hypothetical protein